MATSTPFAILDTFGSPLALPADASPLAVVTGASSGIGFELARVFATNEYDVVIAAEDKNIHRAARLLASIGPRITPFQVDLSSEDGPETLVRFVRGLCRPVDALALNAGVGLRGAFVSSDLSAELKMVALNIGALISLAKLTVSDMVRRGEGRVLVTCTLAPTVPVPYSAVYSATQAFVHSFAESMRYELRDSGVSVTTVHPGATDTNFFRRAGMLETRVGAGKKADPAAVAWDSFHALMAGRPHVTTARLHQRVVALLESLLPMPLRTAFQARQTLPVVPSAFASSSSDIWRSS